MQTAANDSRNELACNEIRQYPYELSLPACIVATIVVVWWFMKVTLREWTIRPTVYKNIFRRSRSPFLAELCRDAAAFGAAKRRRPH